MENAQSSTNQDHTETAVQQQASSNNSRLPVIVIISVLLTAIVTGSITYLLQKSANEKSIDDLRQEITTLKNQVSQVETKDTTPTPTSLVSTNNSTTNSFTYKNFSLNYPNDWVFLDMSTSETFPLKERLASLSTWPRKTIA